MKFPKGHIPWNKGKPGSMTGKRGIISEETRQKMRENYNPKSREALINRNKMPKNRPSRQNHYRWKGGRFISDGGYVMVLAPLHRRASPTGYIREHIIVFEKFYNCSLLKWGIIHHKNGVRDDNRIENLEGMVWAEHSRMHGYK